MATQEDVLKLIMKTEGEEDLRRMTAEFERDREALRQLQAQVAAGSASVNPSQIDAATQAMQRSAAAMLDQRQKVEQLNGGMRNMGMAALEGSRALEDLQYGVAGVVNNIPSMVMALGGGAGLTAAISLAAVAVNQLVKHWDELAAALGLNGTETEAERMERLEKATHRTAEETQELVKWKKEQQRIEEIMAQVPEAEKTQKGAVLKALGEAQPGAVVKGLAEAEMARKGGARGWLSDAERAEVEQNEAALRDPAGAFERFFGRKGTPEEVAQVAQGKRQDVAARLAEAQGRAMAETTGHAKELLAKAMDDPQALKALIADVGRNPGAFPAGLSKDLEDALPENRRQQAEWEAQGKANGRAMLDKMRRDKEQADRIARNAKPLGQMEDDFEGGAVKEARDAHDKAAKQQEQRDAELQRDRDRQAHADRAQHEKDIVGVVAGAGPGMLAFAEAGLAAQRQRPDARAAIGRDMNLALQQQFQMQGHTRADAAEAANLLIAKAMQRLQETQKLAQQANQRAIQELRKVAADADQLSANYQDDMANLTLIKRGQR